MAEGGKERVMDDLISRQAAIDALTHKWDGMVTSVFDVLKELPSVQPEHLVKESGNLVKGLVNDCISRQAVLDKVSTWTYDLCDNADQWAAVKEIEELPSVQPQRWIPVTERLPEPEEEVLWSCHFPGESEYFPENWFLRISSWTGVKNHGKPDVYGIGDAVEILAWMPLPEPWRGGQDETD